MAYPVRLPNSQFTRHKNLRVNDNTEVFLGYQLCKCEATCQKEVI